MAFESGQPQPNPTISFTDGAHNFVLDNANFLSARTINNNYHAGSQPQASNPVAILQNARAVEATHTSNTASYAPKCKPGTRLKIITDLIDWVNGPTIPTSILWFSGPAGGGKTCIMREVVTQCEEQGFLAASYFFSTRIEGLDHERPFVATLAHQLSTSNPVLAGSILQTIARTPGIFAESLDLQLKKLVIEPLGSSSAPSSVSSPYRVIIAIDGFDECRNQTEREHLLRLLHSLIEKLPQHIRIILASRPELDIRMAFNAPHFRDITHLVRLQDYDGNDDVRDFVCDELAKICENHPMKESIPLDWPGEDIVNPIVVKSSGLFIFPATLMKYVNNPRRNPVDLLQRAMATPSAYGSTRSEEHPLAELDALYDLILHPPDTDLDLLKRLLHCIMGIEPAGVLKNSRRSPSFLDQLFQLAAGTVNTTLCDLHSVLGVPPPESNLEPITFHHKSLEDYLLVHDRSRDLYQPPYQMHVDITVACFELFQSWSNSPVISINRAIHYAIGFWDVHLPSCLEGKPSYAILPDTILDFDARKIWSLSFVRGATAFYSVEHIRSKFHSAVCTVNGSCTTLCKTLLQMHESVERVSQFSAGLAQDTNVRLTLLPRFMKETGLYPGNFWTNKAAEGKVGRASKPKSVVARLGRLLRSSGK